jgi:coenzyme F420-dependent glucose-6-phosphate dehydrogenase
MAEIGYQASHEQFKPSDLIKYAIQAENAGFKCINSSDHFHPWSERQGESGFSFSWLGAAMQATNIPFGVVCSPGQRYHPAIVAQAAATLAEMFSKRFWMAIGSGEALNESITGEKWPSKSDRNLRLLECATIIRRLFNGETVSHKGLITIENAKLYTRPLNSPLLLCAAVSKETAAWAGTWADGLLTVQKPYGELKEVVDAFQQNGGMGKPMYLKVQLSYAKTDEQALAGAYDQWKTNIFQGSLLGDLPTTGHFDEVSALVKPQDLHQCVRISSDVGKHIAWLREDVRLGFQKIILHNVNRDQETFIEDFGKEILPLFS